MGRVNTSVDTVELTVPELGPATDRAIVVSWAKRTGERVAVDEPICRLAVGDSSSRSIRPADGELTRIFAEEGAQVLERSSLAEVAVELEPGTEPAARRRRRGGARSRPPTPASAEPPKEKIVTIEAEPIDPEFAPIDPVVEPPPVRIPSEPLDPEPRPRSRAASRPRSPRRHRSSPTRRRPSPRLHEAEPAPQPPQPGPSGGCPPATTSTGRAGSPRSSRCSPTSTGSTSPRSGGPASAAGSASATSSGTPSRAGRPATLETSGIGNTLHVAIRTDPRAGPDIGTRRGTVASHRP